MTRINPFRIRWAWNGRSWSSCLYRCRHQRSGTCIAVELLLRRWLGLSGRLLPVLCRRSIWARRWLALVVGGWRRGRHAIMPSRHCLGVRSVSRRRRLMRVMGRLLKMFWRRRRRHLGRRALVVCRLRRLSGIRRVHGLREGQIEKNKCIDNRCESQ